MIILNTFFYLGYLFIWRYFFIWDTFPWFFLGLFQYNDAGSSLVPTRWGSWSGNVTKLDGTGVGQQIDMCTGPDMSLCYNDGKHCLGLTKFEGCGG